MTASAPFLNSDPERMAAKTKGGSNCTKVTRRKTPSRPFSPRKKEPKPNQFAYMHGERVLHKGFLVGTRKWMENLEGDTVKKFIKLNVNISKYESSSIQIKKMWISIYTKFHVTFHNCACKSSTLGCVVLLLQEKLNSSSKKSNNNKKSQTETIQKTRPSSSSSDGCLELLVCISCDGVWVVFVLHERAWNRAICVWH